MATTTLAGTTGNDLLQSPGSVATEVVGFQGNDTITLNRPDDIANAGSGDDSITLSFTTTATNTVNGGDGADILTNTTAVSLAQGSYSLGAGADTITLTAQLVGGTWSTGTDADRITFSGGSLNSFVGSGQGNDSVVLNGVVTNSTVFGGKGADSIFANGTVTLSTINASDGHDRLQLSGLGAAATNAVFAAGKGADSINMAAVAFGSIAGGGLNDTISFVGNVAGGVVFGDALGVTTAGTGTEGAADGNDIIASTANTVTVATSVYGAGGNDTIKFAAINANSIIDGGDGNDLIGTTGLNLAAVTGIEINGGAGNDTIVMEQKNGTTGINILGGAGNDSIYASSGLASINGGEGADYINLSNVASAALGSAGIAIVNGGDGADTIFLGNFTAMTVNSAGAISAGLGTAAGATVVYGAGDKLFFTVSGAITAANWRAENQIQLISAGNTTALTANLTTIGDIGVFTSGNDLVFAVATGVSAYQFIEVLGGSALVDNTTAYGVNILTGGTVFNFSVAGSSTTDLTITFG